MKKIIVLVLCLTLVLMAGCSANGEGSNNAASEQRLIIGTGGLSGVYYPVGGGISTVINNHVEGASSTIQSTAGSVENIRLLKQGQIDFAFATTAAAYYAQNGIELFDGDKVDNISGVAVLYPQPTHIVVAADSPINTFEDLIGKKIGVGAPASGDEGIFRELMSVMDVTYDDFDAQFISFQEQSAAFKDKQIDAMFITAGTPTAGVLDVASVKDVKLVSIEGELRDKLIEKYPYYVKTVIPKGMYPGQEEDIETIASPAYLVASTDLSEELVYNVCKAMFENLEELHKAHNQAKNIELEKAIIGSPIDMHPGAEKYYKERGLY